MTRFVLVGPARSGTTALRAALGRHPQVVCHGEILSPNRVIGLFPAAAGLPADAAEALLVRNRDTVGFIEQALGTSRPVNGFKVLYNQIVQVHAAEALAHLLSDPRLAIIFLWRRNLARRFLSEQKLRVQYAKRAAGEREFALNPSPEEMFQDCRNQLRMRDMVKALFEGHPAVELVYEDIVERRSVPEIGDVLGLASPEVQLSDRKEDYRNDKVVTVSGEAELLEAYEVRRGDFEPL